MTSKEWRAKIHGAMSERVVPYDIIIHPDDDIIADLAAAEGRIAELEAAALRADAAGWVSFDDPPKTDGQYHVYRFATNGTYKGRPFQWIAMWENGTWLDYDPMVDDYIHECEPTHWRPLPPAPEEAKP